MGMCLEDFGQISVEIRRESFIVHAGYGYTSDGARTSDDDHFGKHWREGGHPEFLLVDLDDIIAALQDAKRYMETKR
jgi:hypothetical protein